MVERAEMRRLRAARGGAHGARNLPELRSGLRMAAPHLQVRRDGLRSHAFTEVWSTFKKHAVPGEVG